MSQLEFRVLGPLEVRRDGELVLIPGPKPRALLGLLLLHANTPILQAELIDLLWGEEAPRTARAALQNYIHGIRRLLGADVLERQPGGYVVHVEDGQFDLQRFERLVVEARTSEPWERAAKLREALACWRGPALAEFSNEPFAQYEAGRLEEQRVAALEERIDADLALGRHAALVPELEALVGQHPLRERFAAQLMVALYRAGRQADALAAYRRVHHALVAELGVEPGFGLRELQRAILVQDHALQAGGRRIGAILERAAQILPVSAEERASSLCEYGVALIRTGEARDGAATLEAAVRLAAAAGADDIRARADLYLSYAEIWTAGKSLLAHLAEAEKAAEHFAARNDDEGLFVALRQQSQMLHETGRAQAALALARRCLDIAARSGIPGQRRLAATALAAPLAAGPTPAEEAIALCERELDSGHVTGIFMCQLAVLYAQSGRVEEARALLEQTAAGARRDGSVAMQLAVLEATGLIAFSAAQLDEAEASLRAAHGLAETEQDHGWLPTVAAELACVLAHSGNSEAHGLALTARATTAPDVFRTEVMWRRALAILAAHQGQNDEARQLSSEACARATASDWLTFLGETLEEAATIRELAGDASGAHEALAGALAAYERKGNLVGADRVLRYRSA